MEVSVAVAPYDHVLPLVLGDVCIPGVSMRFHHQSRPAETFHRQLRFEEWDVAEMSLTQFFHAVAAGDERFVGLPVFPSRCFRHSSVFVAGDSSLRGFEQLAGHRVGVPEWGQTAGVWLRGLLVDQFGVDLASISWLAGGVEEPGRPEHAALELPPGIRLERATERGLAEELMGGGIDAVVAARFPAGPLARGRVRPLIADSGRAEVAYFEQTGLFPIMHVLVMRRALHEHYRWLARELVTAFTEAKARSLARLLSPHTPMFPVPHLTEQVVALTEIFGSDPWPYGVPANRRVLETFARYAHDQGIAGRLVGVEELFAPSTVEEFHG